MKETGIIMSGDHPKLILDGIKTMTRRVIKPQPDLGLDPFESYSHIEVGRYHPALVDKDEQMYPGDEIFGAYTDDGEWGWKCPYGQVGDSKWLKKCVVCGGNFLWPKDAAYQPETCDNKDCLFKYFHGKNYKKRKASITGF